MQCVEFVALAFGYPLLAFTFGWVLLARCPWFDAEEKLVAAFGLGFALLAAAQFVAFLTAAPQPVFTLVVLAAFLLLTLVGGAEQVRVLKAQWTRRLTVLALLWTLGYLHLLLIQCRLPYYVGSNWWGDWHHHFLAARVFLGDLPPDTEWDRPGMYTVASRTPLFDLGTALPLQCTGPHFWAFQITSVAPSLVFPLAVYLLLRDLFCPRTAWLALLLPPLNLWLLHNAWFTWPKMLAAYYLLLSLHFYLQMLRRRHGAPQAARAYFVAFWCTGLLSYLTHQVAAVYLACMLCAGLALALWERQGRALAVAIPVLCLAALLLLGPWYGWLLQQFGSSFIAGSTPVSRMSEHSPDVFDRLGCMAYNVGTSLYPLSLSAALQAPTLDRDDVYRGLTELSFSLFTGALTLALAVYLLLRLPYALPHLRRLPSIETTTVIVVTAVGTLGALWLHPIRIYYGVAHAALFSSVLLLLTPAWGVLGRAPRLVAALVCLGMVVEFLLLFWLHLALLETPLLLDPSNLNVELQQTEELVLLHDWLGRCVDRLTVLLLLVQGALVVCLGAWVWRPEVGAQVVRKG